MKLLYLDLTRLSVDKVTETILGWFFLIPSLQQVNLAKNNFTGVEIFKPVDSNLVAVDLGYNKIIGYPPASFSAYPMLASLTLSYNKLRKEFHGSTARRRPWVQQNHRLPAAKGVFLRQNIDFLQLWGQLFEELSGIFGTLLEIAETMVDLPANISEAKSLWIL
ncbi:hypothetical protein L1887_19460 [Cichorium endivia]|nr:hypothetical protein L1887_19460 [Cichorium endivia]